MVLRNLGPHYVSLTRNRLVRRCALNPLAAARRAFGTEYPAWHGAQATPSACLHRAPRPSLRRARAAAHALTKQWARAALTVDMGATPPYPPPAGRERGQQGAQRSRRRHSRGHALPVPHASARCYPQPTSPLEGPPRGAEHQPHMAPPARPVKPVLRARRAHRAAAQAATPIPAALSLARPDPPKAAR